MGNQYVTEQKTYFQKTGYENYMTITCGYSTGVGCLGDVEHITFARTGAGVYAASIQNTLMENGSLPFNEFINVQAFLRYPDASFPLAETDVYTTNVEINQDNSQVIVGIIDSTGAKVDPDFDTHVLMLELTFGIVVPSLVKPKSSPQSPKTVIDQVMVLPGFINLSDPENPSAAGGVIVTYISENYWEVQTVFNAPVISIKCTILNGFPELCAAVATTSVPDVNSIGMRFSLKLNSVDPSLPVSPLFGVFLDIATSQSDSVSTDTSAGQV